MAPSRSNYAVLPEPVLMEDRRSWNRGSNSGLWLMGVLSGLALLLTTALLVKTYVLNPHPVAHSHLGDGKVNKFDISQIQQIRPSPENDCYGDPSYWHEENFKYCCETAGTGPGCQSMHHNNDDLDRFDPESDNCQGFRGPGFDAPMFEGSYNPSYQSGSYDPTDSVGTIGSDGYPPEIVSHEVIDEDGPFQSDPYADFEQPDPKDFHPKEEFIDCTSPKDDDTIKKLEICCHHGNAGCDILAAKKAAKKAAEEKESEEKRKKKEKEQKEKEEREKKEKEQKEKEEREKKEKEEKEKEEQEKKEREEKEKKEREEKEKKLKEEKEEEPKEEKEEKPKEEKEAKPKEEKEEKPKEKKEEKPKEEEEKPKEEKEEKPKEDKEEKPKEEKEEKPKEEKEEKPKEEKETKDTPKPATPEQPKKPAEEKNEESSKDKTEKPKTKASETKLKVKKAEEIGITTAIPATTLETSTTQHVAWYDKQNQVVWPTFNRLKLK